MNRISYPKNFIVGGFLAFVCLFSNNIQADCDSTVPMHYPTLNSPNYQGSAHTDSFDCAVNGTKQLSLEEINERMGYLPPNLNNRFYLRIGANAAAEGLIGISNIGANNSNSGAMGTLQNDHVKVADNNFEIAFGYTWSDFAVDFEWLASKAIDYQSTIIDFTPTFTVYSTVKGDALLFNLYWIFKDMYNVKMYGDLIVGKSQNNSQSYITNGAITQWKITHWAFGLGLGGRFNLFSKFYADVCARYIYLGTARIVASQGSNAVFLKAKRTWMGMGVCLLWLF